MVVQPFFFRAAVAVLAALEFAVPTLNILAILKPFEESGNGCSSGRMRKIA